MSLFALKERGLFRSAYLDRGLIQFCSMDIINVHWKLSIVLPFFLLKSASNLIVAGTCHKSQLTVSQFHSMVNKEQAVGPKNPITENLNFEHKVGSLRCYAVTALLSFIIQQRQNIVHTITQPFSGHYVKNYHGHETCQLNVKPT